MSSLTRRTFIQRTALGAAAVAFSARSRSQIAGANTDIRIAIAGLNGRGKQLAADFRTLRGVRIVALCDVDTAVLDRERAAARAAGTNPDVVMDFRDVLPRSDIDAIVIATPNHHHALQAIWAMQAGKDVLLEKPVSHNQWELAQLRAAARKYGRIIGIYLQNRSSPAIAEAIEWLDAGNLGKRTLVRGIVYKRRLSIGKVPGPVAPPKTVNYDLFQGPAPMVPLRRTHFHYDWHWQWATGNGDMVAQGNHQLDVGRRLLGNPGHPGRVFTVGGRFGYEDDGETPNTFIVHYDYSIPFIFEIRGLPRKPDALSGNAPGKGGLGAAAQLAATMDTYLGVNVGNIAHCEDGYLAIPSGNYALAQAFDRRGRLIREFKGFANHSDNFLAALRSRNAAMLACPLEQGIRSTTLVHLANTSHRTGPALQPGEIREQLLSVHSPLLEPFGRFSEHLAANEVDLGKTPATLGAPLNFDATTETFIGENAGAANQLLSRDYRAPFVVPSLATTA